MFCGEELYLQGGFEFVGKEKDSEWINHNTELGENCLRGLPPWWIAHRCPYWWLSWSQTTSESWSHPTWSPHTPKILIILFTPKRTSHLRHSHRYYLSSARGYQNPLSAAWSTTHCEGEWGSSFQWCDLFLFYYYTSIHTNLEDHINVWNQFILTERVEGEVSLTDAHVDWFLFIPTPLEASKLVLELHYHVGVQLQTQTNWCHFVLLSLYIYIIM